MLEWVNAIGGRFSPEQYLFWTRLQASLWTVADIVLVFYLLRTANLARTLVDRRRHWVPYIMLAMTLPFASVLPFAPTGRVIFRVELLVTVPHFLIILYVLARNMQVFAAALAKLLAEKGDEPLHPSTGSE